MAATEFRRGSVFLRVPPLVRKENPSDSHTNTVNPDRPLNSSLIIVTRCRPYSLYPHVQMQRSQNAVLGSPGARSAFVVDAYFDTCRLGS